MSHYKYSGMKPVKILFGVMILILEVLFLSRCDTIPDDLIMEMDREPAIEPDYAGVTIPPNIAPLNFIIEEEGISFMVDASSSNGRHLSIKSSDGIIRFPVRSWNKLLSDNQGGEIIIEVLTIDKEKNTDAIMSL